MPAPLSCKSVLRVSGMETPSISSALAEKLKKRKGRHKRYGSLNESVGKKRQLAWMKLN